MIVRLKGSFEDDGKVHRRFAVKSKRGMTLEIFDGKNCDICTIELSCYEDTVVTRVNVWGTLSVEQLDDNHVVVKRI